MSNIENVIHFAVRVPDCVLPFAICGGGMPVKFRWSDQAIDVTCCRCLNLLHDHGADLPPELRPRDDGTPRRKRGQRMKVDDMGFGEPDPSDIHALRLVGFNHDG